MPRKAKEKIEKNDIIDEKENSSRKKNVDKKSSVSSDDSTSSEKKASKKSKSVDDKDSSVKKARSSKKVAVDEKSSSVKKVHASKKTSSDVKQSSVKKSSKIKDSNIEKKSSTSKKSSVTKKTSKTTNTTSTPKTSKTSKTTKTTSTSKTTKTPKTTPKKVSKKSKEQLQEPQIQILEYYDLPYKYGHTIVKLLAQTPKTLFVYWEVSDSDINNFKKLFGNDFFAKTKPILIVHNLTLNKTSEVEINDFANCWYLNTEDTDCRFDIELGRKFIEQPINNNSNQNNTQNSDYLHIATSNNLHSPNDHILFEKVKEFAVFKNVKNNNIIKKDAESFKFLKNIYKFYKEMYDEDILNNPSSQF